MDLENSRELRQLADRLDGKLHLGPLNGGKFSAKYEALELS